MSTHTTESLAEFFIYLDGLRASGATNMYGAVPYLEDEFGLPHYEARNVLMSWIKTFDSAISAEDRAHATQETP